MKVKQNCISCTKTQAHASQKNSSLEFFYEKELFFLLLLYCSYASEDDFAQTNDSGIPFQGCSSYKHQKSLRPTLQDPVILCRNVRISQISKPSSSRTELSITVTWVYLSVCLKMITLILLLEEIDHFNQKKTWKNG